MSPLKSLKKERKSVSNADQHFRQFMKTIQNDPNYRWIYSEYKTCPSDAEYAYYNAKAKEQKFSFWSKLKTMFDFSSFTMGGITNKSIEEYLSQARDHYDLEQRERKVMSGNVRFA